LWRWSTRRSASSRSPTPKRRWRNGNQWSSVVTRGRIAVDEPVTDIRRIVAVMLDNRMEGVPITSKESRLLGFVSRSDILRAVVTDLPLNL